MSMKTSDNQSIGCLSFCFTFCITFYQQQISALFSTVLCRCAFRLVLADDIVLLAPSWRAMQQLLSVLNVQAVNLNLSCNVSKIVCMVFNLSSVTISFPASQLIVLVLNLAISLRYIGNVVTSDLSDDADIYREIQNMFVRTNVLLRSCHKCSFRVKILLFRSFCLCLHDVALRKVFNAGTLLKLQSCYNK